MKILYIPFTFEESLGDLLAKADKWKEAYKAKGKDVVTVYHGTESLDREKINLALESGDCQIYILSHGVDTPEFIVSNQSKMNKYQKTVTVEEVAANFKADLLIPEFNNDNIVKLFFCDEYAQDNKAKKMAETFRDNLGELYRDLEVKYYTDVSIARPGPVVDSQMSTKAALRNLKMGNDLICFNLSCVVGNAKSFRHGLNESDTSLGFFSGGNTQYEKIIYPKFSHPILKQLADSLIMAVKNDKILSKRPNIAQEILNLIPTDLKYYLCQGLTLTCNNINLEMKINKEQLVNMLVKMGISLEGLSTESGLNNEKIVPSGWVDNDDFFGNINITYEALDDSVMFTPLEDYDEVLETLKSEDISLKI